MRAKLQSGFLLALLCTLAPTALSAQANGNGRLRPFTNGDGRIHGAPTLQVIEMDLHPGQVQTINLWPRYHTVLEFPFPVARVDGGDPDVFSPDIVGNKLTLKAIDVDVVETSMTIILGDAQQTLIPFLIRADSTQPMAYVVKFVDPVTRHLNDAESDIAKRLSANINGRVTDLAEEHLRQRILFSGGSIEVNKTKMEGPRGDRLGLTVEQAEQMPGPDGQPRLYLRYRAFNGTHAPVEDMHLVARVDAKKRRFLFFTKTVSREVTASEDVRTAASVPPSGSVRGLLILDGVDLKANESLSVELVSHGGKKRVVIPRVLVGQK